MKILLIDSRQWIEVEVLTHIRRRVTFKLLSLLNKKSIRVLERSVGPMTMTAYSEEFGYGTMFCWDSPQLARLPGSSSTPHAWIGIDLLPPPKRKTVSTLIEELQLMMEKHGDILVAVDDYADDGSEECFALEPTIWHRSADKHLPSRIAIGMDLDAPDCKHRSIVIEQIYPGRYRAAL